MAILSKTQTPESVKQLIKDKKQMMKGVAAEIEAILFAIFIEFVMPMPSPNDSCYQI